MKTVGVGATRAAAAVINRMSRNREAEGPVGSSALKLSRKEIL